MKRIITIIIFFAAVAIGFFILVNKKPMTDSNRNFIVSNNTSSRIKKYESLKLGVRFSYTSPQDGKEPRVTENGNTIYFYFDGMQPSEGQSIQIWTKDTNKTLGQTISDQFLREYDKTICQIKSPEKQLDRGISLIIKYTGPQIADEPWWESNGKCPSKYTATSNLAFFWAASETSKKFAYLTLTEPFVLTNDPIVYWPQTLELF